MIKIKNKTNLFIYLNNVIQIICLILKENCKTTLVFFWEKKSKYWNRTFVLLFYSNNSYNDNSLLKCKLL